MSRPDETPDNTTARRQMPHQAYLILATGYDARLISIGGLDRIVTSRLCVLRAFDRKLAIERPRRNRADGRSLV